MNEEHQPFRRKLDTFEQQAIGVILELKDGSQHRLTGRSSSSQIIRLRSPKVRVGQVMAGLAPSAAKMSCQWTIQVAVGARRFTNRRRGCFPLSEIAVSVIRRA
jgi:hypothetical protein